MEHRHFLDEIVLNRVLDGVLVHELREVPCEDLEQVPDFLGPGFFGSLRLGLLLRLSLMRAIQRLGVSFLLLEDLIQLSHDG